MSLIYIIYSWSSSCLLKPIFVKFCGGLASRSHNYSYSIHSINCYLPISDIVLASFVSFFKMSVFQNQQIIRMRLGLGPSSALPGRGQHGDHRRLAAPPGRGPEDQHQHQPTVSTGGEEGGQLGTTPTTTTIDLI